MCVSPYVFNTPEKHRKQNTYVSGVYFEKSTYFNGKITCVKRTFLHAMKWQTLWFF